MRTQSHQPPSWPILFVFFVWLGFATSPLVSAADSTAKPLNFVFILVDDMGWTDVHCFGSKFYETPNIDRLASEGMKFPQAYAACTVCSPTRASLLTGQYPARLHLTDWIPGHDRPYAKLKIPEWTQHLPTEEMNLAKAFKSTGYATISIGKWHLGGPDYYPDKQGFDLNIGGYERGQPPKYFAPYNIPTLKEGPAGEFLSDRLTDEACRFMEQNRDKPFFVYLPHYAVHQPIAGKKDVVEKYAQRADPANPQHNATYAALVESVDDSVGNILKKLDALKIADHTVVIFTSDNGGVMLPVKKPVTSNAPLRAGKGSAYEGGVRVPLIIKWPGATSPGSVCEVPVISADFYPTLLAMANVPDQPGHPVDGESLVPLLKQSGSLKREAVFWHYPHYHPGGATPYTAVRAGDWKLIEFHEDQHVELYNLKLDPGEQTDLAPSQPDKAASLRAKLRIWRESVKAQMPAPNPAFDATKDNELPRQKKS